MEKNTFYITTTLPYVNAAPHIGFALEIIQADIIARYQRLKGKDVFFNTGTDEHGIKIYRQAEKEGKNTQEFCDEYAARFDGLKKILNLSYNNFIRTTEAHHIVAAQNFWRRCYANGDIYKKNYKVKYCVGCELEKTESELENGKCPLHPNLELELIDEENYFFRFSKYQNKLLELYKRNPQFVLPEEKANEIKSFVERGLNDFSISRLKNKLPWGIEVPDDPDHVMYVWFDALVNYISAIGWPGDMEKFKRWWPAFQVAGKDNLRQQSAMWQAMLMSANIPNSSQILIHGFISSDGRKMSKSLGNVIDPFELVNKYGTDAVRYYLSAEIPTMKDGDFSYEKFEARYNGDLANGLGNLIARTITMAMSANLSEEIEMKIEDQFNIKEYWKHYSEAMDGNFLNESLNLVNKLIKECDGLIASRKPWELIKNGQAEEANKILGTVIESIRHIAWMLVPFMPETADKIFDSLGIVKGQKNFEKAKEWGGEKFGKFKKGEVLFLRI